MPWFAMFASALLVIASTPAQARAEGQWEGQGNAERSEGIEPPVPPLPAEVAVRVGRAVVLLERSKGGGGHHSAPNAFLVAPNRLVTARHCIEGCDRAWANFGTGGIFEILGVVGDDAAHDVAVLAIDIPAELAAPLSLPDTLPTSDAPVAMVARHHETGVVHSEPGLRGRLTFDPYQGGEMLESSARGWPGCSGAALVDATGRVAGVVCAGEGGRAVAAPMTVVRGLLDGEAMPLAEWQKRNGIPTDDLYYSAVAEGLNKVQAKDFAGAAAEFQKALELSSADVTVSLWAWRALAIAEPERARRFLEDVTKSHPDHAGAWLLLGIAKHREGKFEEAKTAYRCSILVHPNAEACYWLACALLHNETSGKEAIQALECALELEPDHPRAPGLLVWKCRTDGEGVLLGEISRRLARDESAHPRTLMVLASALSELGQEEARDEVLRALEAKNPFLAHRCRVAPAGAADFRPSENP